MAKQQISKSVESFTHDGATRWWKCIG